MLEQLDLKIGDSIGTQAQFNPSMVDGCPTVYCTTNTLTR